MSAVRVVREGPVTTVLLSRPERRNAVDGPTALALADAFRGFEADPDAAVAVLHGEGGVFCAGADLKAVGTESGNRVQEHRRRADGPHPDSRQRTGLLNGDNADGDWKTPAMVAASASETLLTSLPKKRRAASATPTMPNDPRWPRVMSLRYISRIASFDARVVRISDTQTSSSLRRTDFSRASLNVIPGNIFGRKTLRATCCVIVLAPAMY